MDSRSAHYSGRLYANSAECACAAEWRFRRAALSGRFRHASFHRGRASPCAGRVHSGCRFSFVALLKRAEDAEKPVNLRLRFAVAAEGEVFEIPEISWNQRDEVLLAAGESWVVKLEIRN